MGSAKIKSKEIEPKGPSKISLQTRQHLVAGLILLILPLFLYHTTILGGQQYMGNDVLQWRAGAESLIAHQEETGEVAHWAENMFSGMPATTISHPPQVKNIDNTLLSALQFIYPAAEMWILLAGAYFMLILLGLSPFAAVFGSVVIGFSTYIPIIIGAGHNAKFLAYIYIPWIYIGYLKSVKDKKINYAGLFIFALALALHLRAYHPQVTYMFLFPLLTLFIYDFVCAWKENRLAGFGLQVAGLAAGAAAALLIVAQLYWSTLEYSGFSMRGGSELAGTGGLMRDYAFSWSQGWSELLTLMIPEAFGGSQAYWGPKTFTSGPHYFGSLTLLFLMVGAFLSRHRLKWVFLGPGILTLLFSLGENFGALNNLMFAYFPLFDKFRVPETWLMVTVFCLAVVAAMGFHFCLERITAKKLWPEIKIPALITLSISLIALVAIFQLFSYEKPNERRAIAAQIAAQNNVSPDDPRITQSVTRVLESQLKPDRREAAQSDGMRYLILLVLAAGVLAAMSMGKLPLQTGAVGLILIASFDIIQVDSRYLGTHSLVDQNLTREQVLEQQRRPLDSFLEEQVAHEEGWDYRVLPLLDNAFNNAIPSYFYPSAGGYSGAKLGYYQDLIDEAFFSGESGLNNGVLSMLNIRYLTLNQPLSLPGYDVVYEGADGYIIENRQVLPKAFFVERVEQRMDQADVLAAVSSDFNPVEVAFVSEESPVQASYDSTATITIDEYQANRIALTVERNEPGFLVLGEIWYPPGWTLTINGSGAEIIRTNYVLRGMEVPAGESRIELELKPVWYTAGYRLSVAGSILLLLLGILAVYSLWKEGREEKSPV